jgi:hypothetical protein
MNLEKFDLEKVIHGAKVVTRDGREVLELTKFENIKDYPLVGVLDNEIQSWTIEGYYMDGFNELDADLFLVGRVRRIWANVMKYPNGDLFLRSECFSTLEAALNFARNSKGFKRNYVKTIEITDEV